MIKNAEQLRRWGWRPMPVVFAALDTDCTIERNFDFAVLCRLLAQARPQWRDGRNGVRLAPGEVYTYAQYLSPDRREDPHFNQLRGALRRLKQQGLIEYVGHAKGYKVTLLNYLDSLRVLGFKDAPMVRTEVVEDALAKTELDLRSRSKITSLPKTRRVGPYQPHVELRGDARVEAALTYVRDYAQERWFEIYREAGVEWIRRKVAEAVADFDATPRKGKQTLERKIGQWLARGFDARTDGLMPAKTGGGKDRSSLRLVDAVRAFTDERTTATGHRTERIMERADAIAQGFDFMELDG